ncbi:hypothetical protein C8J57DRAFT_721886 [Mycena rebaudengoi]|nr:hypothetical protein C8J57DRAFT_721886 [Mycena rebaudengoi]
MGMYERIQVFLDVPRGPTLVRRPTSPLQPPACLPIFTALKSLAHRQLRVHACTATSALFNRSADPILGLCDFTNGGYHRSPRPCALIAGAVRAGIPASYLIRGLPPGNSLAPHHRLQPHIRAHTFIHIFGTDYLDYFYPAHIFGSDVYYVSHPLFHHPYAYTLASGSSVPRSQPDRFRDVSEAARRSQGRLRVSILKSQRAADLKHLCAGIRVAIPS